jgi:hypothetical protein
MIDAIDGNAAVIKLRSKFDADILKDHAKLIESAIADVLGVALKARFEAGAAASQSLHEEEMPEFEESGENADELFGYANERIK